MRFKQAGFLAITFALAACAGTKAAYQAADTLDEQAYVTAELYTAWREEARDMIAAGSLTEAQATSLRSADARATPLVLKLAPLAQSVRAARTATNEAALQVALSDAVVAISSFVDAVKAARGQ